MKALFVVLLMALLLTTMASAVTVTPKIEYSFQLLGDPLNEVITNITELTVPYSPLNSTPVKVVEVCLDEHPLSTTNNGYKWDVAVCNVANYDKMEVYYEDAGGGFSNAYPELKGYTYLPNEGMSNAWCPNQLNNGYPIFISQSKSRMPECMRFIVPDEEGVKFDIYSGTDSDVITADSVTKELEFNFPVANGLTATPYINTTSGLYNFSEAKTQYPNTDFGIEYSEQGEQFGESIKFFPWVNNSNGEISDWSLHLKISHNASSTVESTDTSYALNDTADLDLSDIEKYYSIKHTGNGWYSVHQKNKSTFGTGYFEFDPVFDTAVIVLMEFVPINETAFYLSYCDNAAADDMSYAVYHTDGTEITAPTPYADRNGNNCYTSNEEGMGAFAFNRTYMANFYSPVGGQWNITVVDIESNTLVCDAVVVTGLAIRGIDSVGLNDTSGFISYAQDGGSVERQFGRLVHSDCSIGTELNVDDGTDVGNSAHTEVISTTENVVSITYFSRNDDDIRLTTINFSTGSPVYIAQHAELYSDTVFDNLAISHGMTTINSTTFALVQPDGAGPDEDINFGKFTIDGTEVQAMTKIFEAHPTNAVSNPSYISLSKVSDEYMVMIHENSTDGSLWLRTLNMSGAQVSANQVETSDPNGGSIMVFGQENYNDLGFCNEGFVWGYSRASDDDGIWTANKTDANGNVVAWDGSCEAGVDTTPPSFNTGPTNSTTTNESVYITWTLNEAGNETNTMGLSPSYSGVHSNTNSTKQTSHGLFIGGLQNSTTYAFNTTTCDEAGNCASGDFTFTTASNQVAPSDTCSPSTPLTSSHTFDCNDNCVIPLFDAGNQDITTSNGGSGSIVFQDQIINQADVTLSCSAVTLNG